MARNQHAADQVDPTDQGAVARTAAGTGAQPAVGDAQAMAILDAVEQQLTRYFSAMAARADAVQQAADAGRADLATQVQQQLGMLRGELDRSNQAADEYERALQTAIEERLTEFATSQHYRFTEVENRLQVVSELAGSVAQEDIDAAVVPLAQHVERTNELLASRIEELQKAARRFDEQSSGLVQHVNDTTASLGRRVDETARAFGGALEETVGAVRSQVAEQLTTIGRRIEDSDNRVVDRMLAMEERINEQTGVRMAAVEATMGRISSGIDDAIVALSHRVIEIENNNHALLQRIDEIAESVATIDQEAINQLREQMSSAIGESMLVRIELERVASSTGEQFDKLNVKVSELAAQIADTDMDVSTAIQLERLEELERAISELDPDTFVRKSDLAGGATSNGSNVNSNVNGTHGTALNGAGHPPPPPAPDASQSSLANPSESNLSSW